MAAFAYLDFDLLLERVASGYRARVLKSPAGETVGEFQLPLSSLELENFLLRMGRPRRRVRRLETPETQAAKAVGGQIFNTIFSGPILTCFQSSLDKARRQEAGLRIKLRLTDAPDLADLPWEFLYNPALNRFLALSKETPVVRFLDTPERPRVLTVTPPLKVLVMIASPDDYEKLDATQEWDRLHQTLGDLTQRGLVALEALEDATLPALQRQLRRGAYHIFHFIGHGGFDEAAQDGALLLEDTDGRSRAVSGQNLGTLLNDHRSLRLAVLNACEGARASRTDPFAGVAQSLLQQGLPAVIAMQFEITDDAAVTFAHEFYSALADGLPVDAALAEARRAIFASGNPLEWGTPVLYMRAPDGRIFDIAGPLAPERPAPEHQQTTPRLAELYDQALGYYYTDQWAQAIQLLNEIVALQPAYEDAANKLADATRQQTLLNHYTAGRLAYQARAWTEAVAQLEAAVALAPNYRDAPALLATARQQHELAELYAEAQRVAKTGNWQAVINIFQRIAAIDPAYPDPDGLLTGAQARLAEKELEQVAAAAYSQGLRHLDARDWAAAIAAFERAEAAQPGYQQTSALLARARRSLAEQQATERAAAELAQAYRAASERLAAGQTAEAARALEELLRRAPGYQDAETLLAQARQTLADRAAAEQRRAQLADAYRRGSEALAAHDWDTAIARLTQVAGLEPGYRDVAARLAEARRQRDLLANFNLAVAHMRAERWAEAVRLLREIIALAPDYAAPPHGRAAALLAEALQQKERAELPPPPARRGRPKLPAEEPRPRSKPTDIPR